MSEYGGDKKAKEQHEEKNENAGKKEGNGREESFRYGKRARAVEDRTSKNGQEE